MQDARETLDTEMSDTALLSLARERLRAAMELLGTRGVEAVLDESLDGARVLAVDAKNMLAALLKRRRAQAKSEGGGVLGRIHSERLLSRRGLVAKREPAVRMTRAPARYAIGNDVTHEEEGDPEDGNGPPLSETDPE